MPTVALDEVNFWDLDLFVHGDPHAVWQRLRVEAPVWWHDRPGGEPFWSVTRYEDAKRVLGDANGFSSADGIKVRSDAELEFAALMSAAAQPMIHTDPPRHRMLRNLVAARFTPRSVADLEVRVRELAVECIDDAIDRGEVDFVLDVAHRIPASITLELLGVDPQHWVRLAELEHLMVTAEDDEFRPGRAELDARAEAAIELTTFFAELVADRLGADAGANDLLSTFLRGRLDGAAIPADQVVAEAGLLLAGGLDTTRAAASAGGLLPLLTWPEQLDRLRADRSLLPTAVEEFVRWSTPVVSEARTVVRDVELAGHRLTAGERVVVWTASANRDEAVFEEPDRFDVARHPNRHLGFSHGEHFCLGAHLARLVLRVEFEELLDRVARIELAGPPVRVRSNFVGGLTHLPVRLRAA